LMFNSFGKEAEVMTLNSLYAIIKST